MLRSSLLHQHALGFTVRPLVLLFLLASTCHAVWGQGDVHAGWQAGPVALHTEHTTALGVHNLGNAGYGQALTVQADLEGPWEFELKAGHSAIISDDGGLNGLRTEVQSGSAMVNWVWNAAGNRRDAQTRFAKVSRGFQPFVGIGLAHVDHVTTRDLEDAFGRRYHLWSDGTLRDRGEGGDHGGEASILKRDYTYESEADNNLTHNGRTLAIPAQIGVRLDVSPRVRARMGVGGWLGLTRSAAAGDAGVTPSGMWGEALTSGFVGLGIRLGKLSNKENRMEIPEGMTFEDAALLASMDTDGDGVSNLHDACPGTRGMAVDAKGCPLDSDGDGYADYRDAEPHSPTTRVDANGVALRHAGGDTEASGADQERDVIRGTVTSDDRSNYALHIALPESGLTAAEQHMLLSFRDVSEAEDGLLVEVGSDPLEAGRTARAVRNAGFETELIEPEVTAETGEIPADAAESVNLFRVQLGAYRAPDTEALDVLFEGMEVIRFTGDDGLTRVVSLPFANRADAISFKLDVITRGFTGAFITTHTEQVATVATVDASALEAERTENEAVRQFDVSKIAFRIQLGALRTRMDVDAMDALLELGDIEHRSSTGWHRYLHGNFNSAGAARAQLAELQERGFNDAFVVGDVAGRIVPVAEAEILLGQD